jgi:hypothetical protein
MFDGEIREFVHGRHSIERLCWWRQTSGWQAWCAMSVTSNRRLTG